MSESLGSRCRNVGCTVRSLLSSVVVTLLYTIGWGVSDGASWFNACGSDRDASRSVLFRAPAKCSDSLLVTAQPFSYFSELSSSTDDCFGRRRRRRLRPRSTSASGSCCFAVMLSNGSCGWSLVFDGDTAIISASWSCCRRSAVFLRCLRRSSFFSRIIYSKYMTQSTTQLNSSSTPDVSQAYNHWGLLLCLAQLA